MNIYGENCCECDDGGGGLTGPTGPIGPAPIVGNPIYSELNTSTVTTQMTFSTIGEYLGFFDLTASPENFGVIQIVGPQLTFPPNGFEILESGVYNFQIDISFTKTSAQQRNFALQSFVDGAPSGNIQTVSVEQLDTQTLNFTGLATLPTGSKVDLRMACTAGTVPVTINLNRTNFSLIYSQGIVGPTGPQGEIGGMEWLGEWTPTGYVENQVVESNDWLMIANKTTGDVPYPQQVGEPSYVYNGDLTSQNQETVKTLLYGMRYFIPTGGYLLKYRIYTVAGNKYTISSISDPLTNPIGKELVNFEATTAGWQYFNTNILARANTQFDLVCRVSEPDPQAVPTTFNYDYITPVQFTVPLNGQITQSSKELDTLYINYIDFNGNDNTAFLTSLSIGDLIKIGDQTWAVQLRTSAPTYIVVLVAPAGQWGFQGAQPVEFTSTVATPITYFKDPDPNYWGFNPNIDGFISLTGNYDNIQLSPEQFGVDIEFQNATVSPDWDFMAYSGGNLGAAGTMGVRSAGWLYMNNNETTTSLDNSDTPTKAEGITTLANINDFDDNSGVSNRLRYIGTETKTFKIDCNISQKQSDETSRDLMSMMLYKTGSLVTGTNMQTITDNDGDVPLCASTSCLLSMATNDYVECWVQNYDASANILIIDLQIIATEI